MTFLCSICKWDSVTQPDRDCQNVEAELHICIYSHTNRHTHIYRKLRIEYLDFSSLHRSIVHAWHHDRQLMTSWHINPSSRAAGLWSQSSGQVVARNLRVWLTWFCWIHELINGGHNLCGCWTERMTHNWEKSHIKFLFNVMDGRLWVVFIKSLITDQIPLYIILFFTDVMQKNRSGISEFGCVMSHSKMVIPAVCVYCLYDAQRGMWNYLMLYYYQNYTF